MTAAAQRWTCVEAGCDYVLVAPDVEAAVAGAQRHIADEHGSFELEEMIEDVLEDVPDAPADDSVGAEPQAGPVAPR